MKLHLKFPEDPFNIDKDYCITGRGGSKSIESTKISKKKRSLCLKKYFGENCENLMESQTLHFVKEGEVV